MTTRSKRFESRNDINNSELSRLELKAAELESKFTEWRDWLDGVGHAAGTADPRDEADEMNVAADSEPELTTTIITHGRRTADHARPTRGRKIAIGAGAVAAVIITVTVLFLLRGSPSWPPSVAAVQDEISRACQNSNVASEPGQINFACAKSTNQILWVFSLMTSDDNPGFSDAQTGRKGLEPITPAQGGDIAWSLNLHHPYNPYDPIDSLQVAARAINNIVGGATLTGKNGSPAVQPGLESSSGNCARYTGSGAVISRAGYPDLCALPVSSPAGQAALVADIYQKWMVGSGSATAQNAGVLFENADDPGNPQVQAILKALPGS